MVWSKSALSSRSRHKTSEMKLTLDTIQNHTGFLVFNNLQWWMYWGHVIHSLQLKMLTQTSNKMIEFFEIRSGCISNPAAHKSLFTQKTEDTSNGIWIWYCEESSSENGQRRLRQQRYSRKLASISIIGRPYFLKFINLYGHKHTCLAVAQHSAFVYERHTHELTHMHIIWCCCC